MRTPARTMDPLDWIAASSRISFFVDRDEAEVHARFAGLRARGFITDFTESPVVAEQRGGKIVLSRKSSFFGRSGIRCVIRILPMKSGCALQVRLWHVPTLTAWLCLNYSLATLVVLASFGASFQQSSITEGIATLVTGAIIAAVWSIITGGFNAWVRVHQKEQLDEFLAILRSIARDEPHPFPAASARR